MATNTQIYKRDTADTDAALIDFAATTETISFTSSQTAAQIQAEIDEVGKYIPSGVAVTFQFGDGTYTLDTAIDFSGFYGGGSITIQGNTGDTSGLSTSQSVHLNFNNSTNGIQISDTTSVIFMDYLKITCADGYDCVKLTRVASFFRMRYGYLLHTAKTSSSTRGLRVLQSGGAITAQANYFSNNYYAIESSQSTIYSNGNDDTGTQPTYGLRAAQGGVIAKNGTQPAGSTSNESTGSGGVIR